MRFSSPTSGSPGPSVSGAPQPAQAVSSASVPVRNPKARYERPSRSISLPSTKGSCSETTSSMSISHPVSRVTCPAGRCRPAFGCTPGGAHDAPRRGRSAPQGRNAGTRRQGQRGSVVDEGERVVSEVRLPPRHGGCEQRNFNSRVLGFTSTDPRCRAWAHSRLRKHFRVRPLRGTSWQGCCSPARSGGLASDVSRLVAPLSRILRRHRRHAHCANGGRGCQNSISPVLRRERRPSLASPSPPALARTRGGFRNRASGTGAAVLSPPAVLDS